VVKLKLFSEMLIEIEIIKFHSLSGLISTNSLLLHSKWLIKEVNIGLNKLILNSLFLQKLVKDG